MGAGHKYLKPMTPTYTTKDTNEGLVLRICGIREIQQPVRVLRGDSNKAEVTFIFANSPERQQISDAYFAQIAQRESLESSPYIIAKAIATFAFHRKEFFRSIENLPSVQLDG